MAKAPMVVRHEGGVKFSTEIRGHRVMVDQPEGAGGEDAAPMPLELLGAGLGSCVALYVQQFCASRELPYEGMRVEVQQRGARDPNRIGQFEVRVILPTELPGHYGEMVERVARSCPAHHTLVHGAEVAIAVEVEPAPV
jgi:putative redox protein